MQIKETKVKILKTKNIDNEQGIETLYETFYQTPTVGDFVQLEKQYKIVKILHIMQNPENNHLYPEVYLVEV